MTVFTLYEESTGKYGKNTGTAKPDKLGGIPQKDRKEELIIISKMGHRTHFRKEFTILPRELRLESLLLT